MRKTLCNIGPKLWQASIASRDAEHAQGQRWYQPYQNAIINFCDHNFAELSVQLSGAICRKPCFTVAPSSCSDNYLVLFGRFFGFVSPFWPLTCLLLRLPGTEASTVPFCSNSTEVLRNPLYRGTVGTENQNRSNRSIHEPKENGTEP